MFNFHWVFKGIVHPKMKIQSLSTHPHDDWGMIEWFWQTLEITNFGEILKQSITKHGVYKSRVQKPTKTTSNKNTRGILWQQIIAQGSFLTAKHSTDIFCESQLQYSRGAMDQKTHSSDRIMVLSHGFDHFTGLLTGLCPWLCLMWSHAAPVEWLYISLLCYSLHSTLFPLFRLKPCQTAMVLLAVICPTEINIRGYLGDRGMHAGQEGLPSVPQPRLVTAF